jgi:UDP-glucose 4-epimerase
LGDSSGPVLVTGGAGYIGSHTVLALAGAGIETVVVDDLSTGWREAVPAGIAFHQADIGDEAAMARILGEHRIGTVIHFAGSIRVEESVTDPLKYYGNNTCASRNLIAACVEAGVERFIFSSTAAAYGDAESVPIAESAPIRPVNPYGWSKVMTEQVLTDVAACTGLKVGILRYFNVAGADPAGRSGQRSKIATHLIKIACQVATGKREGMQIFGTDYATPDGTCIRDYIHVTDLADTHLRMLEHLCAGADFEIANCGYGHGYSVREVLEAVEKAAGRSLGAVEAERRAGDAVALVADSTRLREHMGWRPRHDNLDEIVETALAWEKTL